MRKGANDLFGFFMDNLNKKIKARSCIARKGFAESKERIEQESKNSTKSSKKCTLQQMISNVLKSWFGPDSGNIKTKRIYKRGKQCLLVQIKSQIKRKEFRRCLAEMREHILFLNICWFIPD